MMQHRNLRWWSLLLLTINFAWLGGCQPVQAPLTELSTKNRQAITSSSAPLGRAIAISAGNQHTCALTSSGAAMCWGRNSYGQLGDGTTSDRSTPTPALPSDVVSISAGSQHTCALTSAGAVMCWGSNARGQVGDGTTNDRYTPTLALPSGAIAVSSGVTHTCAAMRAGGAKCWGSNDYGELGSDSVVSYPLPADVDGLTSVVDAISAGFGRTLVISEGRVVSWGIQNPGVSEHGFGSFPAKVDELANDAVEVSVGSGPFACALVRNDGVKCWGFNGEGQLGDGTTTFSNTPVNVDGLAGGINAISTGGSHACALTDAGAVMCWGSNEDGGLGDGTTTDHYTPTQAQLTGNVVGISLGFWHTCALMEEGDVNCWGGAPSLTPKHVTIP